MNTEALEIATAAVRMYAESRPRPTHVTKTQAAKMLEVSRPTLDKLIRAGTIRLNGCGQIPIEEVDRARAARK